MWEKAGSVSTAIESLEPNQVGEAYQAAAALLRDYYGGPEFTVPERFVFADNLPQEALGSLALARQVMAVRNDVSLQTELSTSIYDAFEGSEMTDRRKRMIATRQQRVRGVYSLRDVAIIGLEKSDAKGSAAQCLDERAGLAMSGTGIDKTGRLNLDQLLMVCPTVEDIPGLVLGQAGRFPHYSNSARRLSLATIIQMGAGELRDTIDPHRTMLSTEHFAAAHAAGTLLAQRFVDRLSECESLAADTSR